MAKKDIIIIPIIPEKKILTETEREIVYEEIKNKYNINYQHIENFKLGDDILNNIEHRLDFSSIDIILLKNILKYTYPIIDLYPSKKYDKSMDTKMFITLDYDINGLIIVNKKVDLIRIPKYTEISIIGLLFPTFNENFYSIFQWFLRDNNNEYMYSNEFLCNDNIFRNNINRLQKIINEHITNNIFQQAPNNLTNIKETYKNLKQSKYNKLLDYAFLFNTKHNIELFNQIAIMVRYYLDYYDKYLLLLMNTNIYQSNYKVIKKKYFNTIEYYNKLPSYNNIDLKAYSQAIDNTYALSNQYKLSNILIFKELNLLILYEYIYLYGFDSKIVKKYIEEIKVRNIIKSQNAQNRKKFENNKVINIIYERIAQNKFPNLFNENHKGNIFNAKNSFNLLKLTKQYKNIVLLEYEKQEEFIKSVRDNNCPHLKLLNQFRYSNNITKKNYYFKLLKEFINTENNDNSYFKCNNCNFNIMCPHLYYTQKELLKIDNDVLSSKLNENYNINQRIVNKYMSDAPVDFIYFCRICSEEIGKSSDLEQPIEFQDNVKINMAQDEDEIKLDIITSTYHIVLKYVNFNILMINKKS